MFVSSRDTPVILREPHNYLKTEIISKLGVLTDEQLKNLPVGPRGRGGQTGPKTTLTRL